jgi:hypothetical protein
MKIHKDAAAAAAASTPVWNGSLEAYESQQTTTNSDDMQLRLFL